METECVNNVIYVCDILYARDIHENIIRWQAVVHKISEDSCTIVRNYGKYNGKQNTNTIIINNGKNVTKSNATDVATQAIKEAKAMVVNKHKDGYRTLIELGILRDNVDSNLHIKINNALPKTRLDANNFSKPMLASKYKGNMVFPCIAQRKINGVRCFISYKENQGLLFNEDSAVLTSREGILYDVPHIKEYFTDFYNNNADKLDIVFDGELYIFNKLVTDIAGAARNSKNPLNKQFAFICYDLAIPDMNNRDRNILRHNILISNSYDVARNLNIEIKNNIYILDSYICNDDSEAIDYCSSFIKSHDEGVILRDFDADYQFGKRRVNMQKLKQITEIDYKIVDIIPTEHEIDRFNRSTCLFVCKTGEGLEFKVTPYGYSKETKADMLATKLSLIGKTLSVKFYEYTKDNKPFHANGYIREYK